MAEEVLAFMFAMVNKTCDRHGLFLAYRVVYSSRFVTFSPQASENYNVKESNVLYCCSTIKRSKQIRNMNCVSE